MEKTRQWMILTAVGAVAILVAGWFLVASPQHKHAKDLRAQATTVDASNQQLQVQVHQRQAEQAGVTIEQRKLDKIAQQIPDNPALPTLIRQLSAAAQAAGVDLVSLSPSAPAAASGGAASATASTSLAASRAAASSSLVQIPVAVQVTGSYFNVEAFFNAIEKMTRVMKVPSWTMAPFTGAGGASTTTAGGSSSSGQTLPGSVTTTISGLIYELPVVAVAPATAPIATGASTGAAKPASGSASTGSGSTTSSTTTSSSSTSSNGQ